MLINVQLIISFILVFFFIEKCSGMENELKKAAKKLDSILSKERKEKAGKGGESGLGGQSEMPKSLLEREKGSIRDTEKGKGKLMPSLLGSDEGGKGKLAPSLLDTEKGKGKLAPSDGMGQGKFISSLLEITQVDENMATSQSESMGTVVGKGAELAPSPFDKPKKKGIAKSLLGTKEKKVMASSLLDNEEEKGVAPSLLNSVFLLYKEYRTNLAYILMLSIAVCDIFSAMDYLTNLFCYLFGLELAHGIKKILNATEIACFDNGTVQMTLLAVNRFIIVFRMYHWPTMGPSRLEFVIFMTILAFSWTFFLAIIILFQTPLMAVKYDAVLQNLVYDYSYPMTTLYSRFDYFLTIVCPIIILLLYACIVCILKKSRSRGIGSSTNGSSSSMLSQYESRILLQSFISFVYYVIIEILFLYIDYFAVETGWIIILKNYLYAIYYGFNPCVYLATNSEFRQRFFQLFICYCDKRNNTNNNNVIHVQPVKCVRNNTDIIDSNLAPL